MSGTFTGQSIADGNLPSTLQSLYTVPASTVVYIRTFNCYDTNVNATNLAPDGTDIFVVPAASGISRHLVHQDMIYQQALEVVSDGESMVLGAGDAVHGISATTGVVQYYLSGVVET